MNNKNRVQLLGHLGNDPEFTTFEGGLKKSTFQMATTERYRNKEGEWTDSTQWHRVVAWGRLAEDINRYLKKGHHVMITGRLTHRSYETIDGEKKYLTEVTAESMEKLAKKEELEQEVKS